MKRLNIFKETDRAKADAIIDAFIAWTNADHEDQLTLSRNQCCYMRDEIMRLRKLTRKDKEPQ